MHIFITGGTGFIGKALCQTLIQQGHKLCVLTRQKRESTQAVTFVQDFTTLDDFDAVINLAGEPIFDRRWTSSQKQILFDSRIDLTRKISRLIQQSSRTPKVLISGSATGYYGNLPLGIKVDEYFPYGEEFPAQLCLAWEQEAFKAQSTQTRVCTIRTGIVLGKKGGALKQMLPLYRYGLGGHLGKGTQHWAWISLEDHIQAICYLLENPDCQGSYNLVAPHSIPQANFNKLLAQALQRPAFFHIPEIFLKGILGERSQLLLDNQPLIPHRLLASGFTFQDPTLESLFQRIFLSTISVDNFVD